jgi:two-component system KDP operon response regulator KdpE
LLVDPGRPGDARLGADLRACGLPVQAERGVAEALSWLAATEFSCIVVRLASREALDEVAPLLDTGHPTLAVCDQHDEELVVGALERGADAVLVRPYLHLTLEARVRALVASARRFARQPAPIGAISGDEVAANAGEGLSLTPTEGRLLAALARRVGRPATAAELQAEVWERPPAAGSASLKYHIRQLRRKLGRTTGDPVVVGRRGVGYRLETGAGAARRPQPARLQGRESA